ncbi:hypothetical protein [Hugenholtzia roseola]|uniref:hypothetical protein n=1 Tax=Hugenholtzia roseola TaxID=1002 RepID=UPI000426FD7D|nr:hypothetical protein [Hugenholtzia roseola]
MVTFLLYPYTTTPEIFLERIKEIGLGFGWKLSDESPNHLVFIKKGNMNTFWSQKIEIACVQSGFANISTTVQNPLHSGMGGISDEPTKDLIESYQKRFIL